ncbi:MAG: ABC transporter permease [Gammaproteobacteria bacterium]|jgi:sodium transport system permease protein|nr:ABC transporter permease [Gammaproteobacteria bacterium]
MNPFLTVLAKECTDNIRDYRSLFSSLSVALLGPLLIVGLLTFVLDKTLRDFEEPIPFTLMGADYAPNLVAYLRANNTRIDQREAVDDPSTLIKSGEAEIILVIQPNYGERYTEGEQNQVALFFDSSSYSSGRRNLTTLVQLIERYSNTIGMLRLHYGGIQPGLIAPIKTRKIDVSSPADRALMIFSSIPYLLVLVIFTGCFYLAIDATAGEKERGSLEPLLTQPISRFQLVLGKVIAASSFSLLNLTITVISLYFALQLVPFERIGMSLELNLLQLLMIIAVTSPLTLFAASLLTVVSAFSKSYKEAQTYLSFVIIIPTLPLIITQIVGIEPSLGSMFVPSLGQAILTSQIIKGEAISYTHVLLSVGATLLITLIFLFQAIKMYQREQFVK